MRGSFDMKGKMNAHLDEAIRPKRLLSHLAWQWWFALAACIALVIGIISIIPRYESSPEGVIREAVFPRAYAFDDFDAKRTVMDANSLDDAFLRALNGFSYKTASQIMTDSCGYLNYSPLSLYYALAMAASGAKGDTADELLSLLGMSNPTRLSTQSGSLYRRLYTDNQLGKLKLANSLWMDNDIRWKDSYIRNAAKHFYASSFSVDFSKKETGQSMAKWVSDHTNGTLNARYEVAPDQILSLLTTVYFYEEWINKFD